MDADPQTGNGTSDEDAQKSPVRLSVRGRIVRWLKTPSVSHVLIIALLGSAGMSDVAAKAKRRFASLIACLSPFTRKSRWRTGGPSGTPCSARVCL